MLCNNSKSKESVVSYVLSIRDKLVNVFTDDRKHARCKEHKRHGMIVMPAKED